VSSDADIRVAVLCDPAGTARGVGPDAVEALLTTWLKTPIALGHREDGSPYPIGIEGKHLSLGHAAGMTALAIADRPVGIDISRVTTDAADRKVAARLFTPAERGWLACQPSDEQPAAFATLWTVKEALLKRERQGLDMHDLPDLGVLASSLSVALAEQPLDWRPWIALAASPRVRGGLVLGSPLALLRPVATGHVRCAILGTPAGPHALALAWTPPNTNLQ